MAKNSDLIYRPSGKAGEYAPFAFNGYTGCDHDCEYCFNKRGVFAHDWSDHAILRKPFNGSEDVAFQMFQDEAIRKHSLLSNQGIMFSFKTDPCLKSTWRLTWTCTCFCLSAGIPVNILTKAVGWCFDRYEYDDMQPDTGKKMAEYLLNLKEARDMLTIGFTLTGHDELEPGAPSNLERIEALRYIHEKGIKTYVSIEPIIDCAASLEMMRLSIPYVDLFKIGLRSGVPKKYYKTAELMSFADDVNALLNADGTTKVYWKKTLVERLTPEDGLFELANPFDSPHAVGPDYKLFKKY